MMLAIRPSLNIVMISFLLGSFSLVTAQDMNNDYDAIKITIENYFEGFKHGDRARLEKAFAVPYAHMKGYIKDANGQLVEVSRAMNEVIDDWVSRDPNPNFQGRILSINIFSDVAAQATFDFNGIFTDAFQLAKINGEWRIINKFYVDQ
ncbi:MAG: nuclear transport factor 2 family protein [Gammaproteobacteria bacterium]